MYKQQPIQMGNLNAAQGGISALGQAESQGMATLEERLKSFSSTAFERAADDAVVEAKEQAARDDREGKPFYGEKVHTVYGKAYGDSRSAMYATQSEIDIANKSNEFAMAHKNDPEAYRQAIKGYVDTLSYEAPTPELQSVIGISGKKIANQQYGKLNINQFEEITKAKKVTLEQGLQFDLGQLINATVNKDTKNMGLLTDKMMTNLETHLKEGVVSEAEVLEAKSMIRFNTTKGVAEGTLNKLLMDKSEGSFKKARTTIDEYEKNIPKDLTYAEHSKIVDSLNSIYSHEAREARATREVASKQATAALQEATEILNKGKMPSNLKQLEAIYGSGLATDGAGTKFKNAQESFSIYSKISSLPLDEQEKKVAEYKASPTATVSEIKAYERLETNISHKKALVKKDPILAATQDGIIKDLAPIMLTDISNLPARIEQGKKAQAAYGTSDLKVFTDNEMIAFKNYMDNPETKIVDKLGMISKLHETAGNDSLAIFKQMEEKGAGVYAMTGYLVSQGKADVAGDVLRGAIVQKEYPNVVPKDLGASINSRLGNSLSHLEEGTRKMYVDTINYVYASNAEKSGKLDPNTASPKDMDAAIEMVTGGKVVDFNGKKVLPPRPGLKEPLFGNWVKDWTENLKPESFDATPKGVTAEQFIEYLQESQLENAGGNKFFVKYGGKYFQDDKGKKFVLEYNK